MPSNIEETVHQMGRQARTASYRLAQLSTEQKNEILRAMAASIRAKSAKLIEANALDLQAGQEKGLSKAMLDRLKLDQTRIEAMAAGIDQVATLPDPVGQVLDTWDRPNGIQIEQVRVPIGTIGIIYESRPNVTADAAVLCFKTGNATILRGGSEAIHSNRAIAEALQTGGANAGLPDHAVQLIPFTDRESVAALAGMDQWLDLIIPRGGKGLIEAVVSMARMPVIKHYDGICHLFADKDADQEMAVALTVNSKTHKPGVCNALETLLVHQSIAADFLPKVAAALLEKGVELRGCSRTLEILPDLVPAVEEDWDTEYLDLILSAKVVDSLEQAVAHINHHGSHHTDVIVTANQATAEAFMRSVDSACVFHNVSTRFNDGGEFGFGAEIGISTDKLHARGPMGLRELTSYQYRVRGNGQVKS
ncbi:glutamate-5-semialdehyde dehydrogenase [Luteolibacter pohnpeiensis]|uniref:Gamma-glutamyl phosphate reductase n=1 Tax=Luteolibacter pohnpeiensis TaxID=454153 RepID=A0A934S289_9BACT|nr:glutamate-5-semialdehyde dehydrogenase [Luteolibacter pohnpeiensis]MBK1881860.1 glutamate-5-semialdehyde dehydrogenase [Luteolibacter pohnpeiensis]